MQWQIPENILSLLIVAGVSGTVCLTAFNKRRENTAARSLSLLMLMATFWTIFYILELSAVSINAQYFTNDLSYIPIVTVPVLLLTFIINATGYQNIITRRRLAILFIMPFFTLLLVWTSEYHSLFYSQINFIPDGKRSVMTIVRGPFYWINIIYSYACMLGCTITAFVSLSRNKGIFKSQALILVSGTILPWIGSIIDITHGTIVGIHMVQASFTITGIIFLLGIRRYGFINFSPIGRHVLIDRMEALMLVVDNQRRVADLNPAMATFLGRPHKELIGQLFENVFAEFEDAIDSIYNMSSDSAEISIPFNGKTRHYSASKIPLITGRRDQIGTLLLFTDVTNRVKNEERLKQQLQQIKSLQKELQEKALRDPLTGLYNRRFLEEVTHQHYARIGREEGSIGFLFIDIDNFKLLNDRYGHQAGDAVLVNLSRILSANVRESDVASRYGGEEFLIMFLNTGAEEILIRAEKMRTSFETEQTSFAENHLSATFSGGIAVYPDHGKTINEIINNADAAMYMAKKKGKNRIVIYSPK